MSGTLDYQLIKITHLHPINETGDVLSNTLGVLCGNDIVILGCAQPVHNYDIGTMLPVIQCSHQLRHPALKQSAHLSTQTDHGHYIGK